jgi:hypothetical protein
MKAIFTLATLFVLGTVTATAQSTKENLKKIKADPGTTERAAKADVYVAKNETIIADTSSIQPVTRKNAISPAEKKKKKISSGK